MAPIGSRELIVQAVAVRFASWDFSRGWALARTFVNV